MSRYDAVVKMWQDWNIRSVDDLALRLDNFRILFAYNSGKLENAEIKYDESNAAFTKGVEDCIVKALANGGKINEAIANAINGVAGEYEGTMQDLKNLSDGLRMDVDQLLSRIQSLVYVPAYDDHKASVNALYYAPEGEEPVLLANGTVEMTFRVTPVEAAGQLVGGYHLLVDGILQHLRLLCGHEA